MLILYSFPFYRLWEMLTEYVQLLLLGMSYSIHYHLTTGIDECNIFKILNGF
jgi:hypothetical protein